MLRNWFSIIILFFLSILQLDAQNVTLFNSKQGLSNSCISSLYEDSRNNIWISTFNGLNRFDGVKLNVYYHDDNDPTSLICDDVNFVYEFDRDNIIVGTASGMQVYNYATDRFRTIPFVGLNGDTLSVRFYNISCVNDNGKKRLLACFSGYGNAEITQDNKGDLHLTHINEFNTESAQISPSQFVQDKKGRLWITNTSGYIYCRKGKTFKRYPEINNAVRMCSLDSGNFYVATENHGLFVYDEKSDSFTLVASPFELGGPVCSMKNWHDDRLFICTDGGGLRIYNENNHKVTQSLNQ